MSNVQMILLIFAGMIISLIALHLWVGIIDGIIGGLKKLFHIGKKDKAVWHTLNEEQQKHSSRKSPETTDIQDRRE